MRYFLLAETDPGNWMGSFLPLVTSMFLHGGWAHLIDNMDYPHGHPDLLLGRPPGVGK